jgi:urease accessory protein
MRARAALEVARGQRGRNVIVRMRSDGPIVLRPTPGASDPGGEVWPSPRDAVRVRRAAAAAGPLGGDDLRLDIRVDAGASLVLGDVAASLVLPGPHGERSHVGITARVEAGGWLGLLSQPVIAARGCDHRMTTDVVLGGGGGLVVR